MRIFKRYKHRPEWHIDFRYKDENGVWRRHIEVVGTSKKLAQEALNKFLAKRAEGKFFAERQQRKRQANIKFKDFAAEYYELHAKRLAGGGKKCDIKRLTDAFGEKTLENICVASIQRFYNEKLDAGKTTTTVNKYMNRLRHMFAMAKKWGKFYGENPVRDVERKPDNEGRDRWLDKSEITRLLAACHPRIYPIVVCALHTGMRRGQILGLKWEMIDLDRGAIHGPSAKKGRRPEIPMTPQLREVFAALGPKKEGRVFEVPVITVRRYFDQALLDAGITDFRFHDLRHTFATHFIMRTNDMLALQRMLGHATPQMTQRYAHLCKGHLASEMQIFAAAMPGPESDVAVQPSHLSADIARR